jgi:hypothetical protein
MTSLAVEFRSPTWLPIGVTSAHALELQRLLRRH